MPPAPAVPVWDNNPSSGLTIAGVTFDNSAPVGFSIAADSFNNGSAGAINVMPEAENWDNAPAGAIDLSSGFASEEPDNNAAVPIGLTGVTFDNGPAAIIVTGVPPVPDHPPGGFIDPETGDEFIDPETGEELTDPGT